MQNFVIQKVFRLIYYVFAVFRPVNYLTATVQGLNALLDIGAITSEQLVDAYLSRINQDNHQGLHLRAVIETAPYDKVMEFARLCDRERDLGIIHGALHGIPVLVKDNIATDPGLGMNTTAGSFGLRMFYIEILELIAVGSLVPRDATVVDRLRKAGAIIIGKANLSELSNFKGNITNGWSARGGQTQSAYVVGGYATRYRKD
jgi:amidase